jgi:hypothetical protein
MQQPRAVCRPIGIPDRHSKIDIQGDNAYSIACGAGRNRGGIMRRITCFSAVVLSGFLCCFDFTFAADAKKKPPEAKNIQVKVRAIDTSGKPIAGALAEIWQSGLEGRPWWTARRRPVNGGKEARTGADGWTTASFILTPDSPDHIGPRTAFCLTVRAEGRLTTRSGIIDPASGDHFEAVLTMRRLAAVEGRVVDPQGRPVADAVVFHTGNALPRVETKTDAQGRFRLDGLPEGTPPIFVSHPAYHFHGQLVDITPLPIAGEGLGARGADAATQVALTLTLSQRERGPNIAGETPPPMRTLPPLRSHEEEMKMARRVIRPLWEAAIKSEPEWSQEWFSEFFAAIDPWAAYDFVNSHLSKQPKSRFVTQQLSHLYPADPEEALAVLESLDDSEESKASALLMAIRETPGLTRRQKLDLLDRASQHLRAATDPGDRVSQLGSVALQLFKLGKKEEAKKIVESVTPAARQLSPKSNPAAYAKAGEAVALFDLPAGLQMVRAAKAGSDDSPVTSALFHIACRIAKQRPDEAERLAAEAVEYSVQAYPAFYRSIYHRDPAEEQLYSAITGSENQMIPLCYELASVDVARAERLAATIRNPAVRAYAVGMIAKALAASDRAKARRMVLQAYDTIEDARRNPDHRWPWFSWDVNPTIVAGGLLPVVEEIDPTLLGECLWRAVSFRLHRPADDFLVSLEPETNDATLATFAARYDRRLALALMPPVSKKVKPSQPARDEDYQIFVLVMVDAFQALEKVKALAAEPGADAKASYDNIYIFTRLLPVAFPRRWDSNASQHGLWVPENESCR